MALGMTPSMTREQWLLHFVDALRPIFADAEFPLPESVRVSMGFPCKKALGPKRRIGECHFAGMKDGIQQIFITPSLEDPIEIGATLVHELCHVITPGSQHKGKFITAIRAIGLTGKPTATTAGESLRPKLAKIVKDLTKEYGAFPHAKLEPHHVQKQTTRSLKAICGGCVEPRIIRVTQKVNKQGTIVCGLCSGVFEVEEK